jgi:hypothetical protein
MLLALLLLACSDKSSDDSGNAADGGTADGGTADGGTADGGSGECTAINDGNWAWRGECPQMGTPVVIAVDGCALALDYDAVGGMTMGMPYAGTLGVDTVVFDDGDSVGGCVGDILGPDEIEGSCDGGCTYTLEQ